MNNDNARVGNSSRAGSGFSNASLNRAAEQAMQMAKRQNHQEFTIEHILLFLLKEPDTLALFNAESIDVSSLQSALQSHINTLAANSNSESGLRANQSLRDILVRAHTKSVLDNKKEVKGPDILNALLVENNSFAAQLLMSHGLTSEQVKNRALELYLADVKRSTVEMEKVQAKIKKQLQEQVTDSDNTQFKVVEAPSSFTNEEELQHTNYSLRVSGKDDGVVHFKAAVSHDGQLDLYIEKTPFEIHFIAKTVAALFEAIEGNHTIKVEFMTDTGEGITTISGFSGHSGAIFKTYHGDKNQRSGKFK